VIRLPSAIAYARWLALLRVATGAVWLVHAIPKFLQNDAFMPPNGSIDRYVAKALQSSNGIGAYHDFLQNVVQPNLAIFAELVRVGELMVGLSLVLGVLARLGGLGGVLLTLNFLVAGGGALTFEGWGGLDAVLLFLTLPNLVLPTGRVWGVDAFFAKKDTAPATIRAEFVDEPPPHIDVDAGGVPGP
jgi:thiosulfate dehydrogenase [quinone] large subunit